MAQGSSSKELLADEIGNRISRNENYTTLDGAIPLKYDPQEEAHRYVSAKLEELALAVRVAEELSKHRKDELGAKISYYQDQEAFLQERNRELELAIQDAQNDCRGWEEETRNIIKRNEELERFFEEHKMCQERTKAELPVRMRRDLGEQARELRQENLKQSRALTAKTEEADTLKKELIMLETMMRELQRENEALREKMEFQTYCVIETDNLCTN